MNLCLQGDRQAWTTLILRYKRLVYSIPKKYRFAQSDCEDVVHDVWLVLLEELHTLRNHSKIYAWLMTTTNRKCMALAAEKARVETREIGEGPDRAMTSEEILLWTEKQQGLREGLDTWHAPCSGLLKTLFFDELSYKEAAGRLEKSREGIGIRRARCLERLRKRLAERGITRF